MTPQELKKSRELLSLSKADMARAMLTPYRTYVDWERGTRRIPGICEACIKLMIFNLERYEEDFRKRLQTGRL